MTAELAADILIRPERQPEASQLAQAQFLLSEGMAQAQQQSFEAAIAHLSQSIQLAYESITYQNTPGNIEQVGALETAGIKEILLRGYYHRACILCRMDCYAQAVGDFTELLKRAADSAESDWLVSKLPEIYIHRGNAYRRLDQSDLALADLDEGVTRSAGSAQSYSCRGLLKLDKNDLKGAIADFNQALETHPTFAQGYLWRGFAHLRSGQPELAVADLSHAIEAIPNCAEAYNHRGVGYFQLNQIAQAKRDFEQAIQLNNSFVEAHNNRGNVRQLLGDCDGAIADYNRAITTDPLIAELYFNRAATEGMVVSGELESVAADYDATTGLPLNSAAFYRHRAKVRSQQQNWDAAIADYSSAIAITPTAYAHYHRGRAYLQVNDFKKALEDFDRSIKLSPDYGLPYSDRSFLRLQSHDLSGALADANRALELCSHSPDSPVLKEILTTRCLIHFYQRNSENALQDFDSLVSSIVQAQSSSSQTSKDSTSIGSASD